MKKKIVIISIALMAFAVAFATNSWAHREKNGDRRKNHVERLQKMADTKHGHLKKGHWHKHFKDRFRDKATRRDFNRAWPRFKQKDFKRHHYRPGPWYKHRYGKQHRYRPPHWYRHKYVKRYPYRAPQRFWPGYRSWRHRPVYKDDHPGYFRWWDRFGIAKEFND